MPIDRRHIGDTILVKPCTSRMKHVANVLECDSLNSLDNSPKDDKVRRKDMDSNQRNERK